MYFLNPPENLLGSPGVLGSPEYRSLKRDAQDELARLDSPRPKAARRGRRQSAKKGPRPSHKSIDAAMLLLILRNHHSTRNRDSAAEPLLQKQIAKEMGVDQSRVSRAFKVLFPEHGMSEYHALLQSGRLRGYLTRCDNGLTEVTAIDE